MRRLLAILLPVVALFAAGCGGGDDSGSALDSALAYLPKDTPFAVALETDVGGDQYQALGTLLDKFPFGDQIKGSLVQQLERSSNGLSFEDDIKPVLGNPLVVGAVIVSVVASAPCSTRKSRKAQHSDSAAAAASTRSRMSAPGRKRSTTRPGA